MSDFFLISSNFTSCKKNNTIIVFLIICDFSYYLFLGTHNVNKLNEN